MKKILFVINTLGMAGAEKALIEILKRLDTPDYEVSLFVLMNQGELRKELPNNVRLLNKQFDDCPIHGSEGAKHIKKHVLRSLLSRGTFIKQFGYLAVNTIKMIYHRSLKMDKLLWYSIASGAPRFTEEYDLAVAYIEGGAAYYVANYVNAKKKASFIHIDYSEAGYNRGLDRNSYFKFDKIFAVSDEVKNIFAGIYPELSDKIDIFHNLLDINGIQKKACEKGGFEVSTGTRILSIGRLNSQKAFEVSIEAMNLLREMNIEAKWYILGEGDQREFLTKTIEEKKLSEHFFLLGNKTNPYTYLKQCDIYVHASKYEGKSIAIQEARILGKPIVVTDCSGNREQIRNGEDGVICDFDSQSIANAVKNMLDNPSLAKQMGEKAAKNICIEEAKNNHLYKLLSLL